MPSPTDFNLSPYYDDYTESKKFHRILFRPAFAVQARELTQSQSILQNQIERMGDHFFEKGAMVIPGEIGYDLNYYAVKLASLDSGFTPSDFIGVEVTGGTSGVVATVINAVATDGTDPDTLFVKYKDSGNDNATEQFSNGETLTATISGSAVTATLAASDATATGSAAYVAQGVYYINGFMVQVSEQTLILDKYSNTPSYRVGLEVTESFITPNDDTSLNDNAAGSSNVNAPGAHRFKIDLTLAKKTLTSTEDQTFIELLRLQNGILQNQVRTTEYAVLEDTLARRTFDESGDYSIRDFDLDLREHLITGNNRGIYTAVNGGDETKIAAGLGPGKAYVKGYEIETIGTTFIDIDKARDFKTGNNNVTRFDLANYVNVTNVYGSPDIGFVSGDVEAFKRVNLYDTANSSRGTENTGSGASIHTIGRAKSKGFEYSSGTASSNILSSSGLTSSVYKHYLFDVNMFTHLNITSNQSFTTGETITGGSSGATGILESISTTTAAAVTGAGITVASPGVVEATAHGLKEGQQITFSAISADNNSTAITTSDVFTVRNPSTNDFELYESDGTTATNITSYSSAGNVLHGVVILSNVQGVFTAGETITGGTSSNTATIQSDAVGFKAVRSYDFTATKHIGMAGSPTYTADVALDTTNGTNTVLTGSIDVGSGSASVTGINTKFTTELKIGDSISFTNNSGNTETKIVEAIISDSSLTLESVTAAASTKTIVTRRRTKLQDSNRNISIFELPFETIKTLKTTSNSGLSDTNFTIRRHFTATLNSSGTATITAGPNETFSSFSENDFSVSIMSLGIGASGAAGDVLSLSGNNHEGDAIFNLTGSPSGKSLTLDFGTNFQGHKIKILASVDRSIANSKSKTLVSVAIYNVTSQSEIESGIINLGKADIYTVSAVYMSGDFSTIANDTDIDITSRFSVDNGQRDNFYDVGRLILKPGQVTPTGRLMVVYQYFSHGTGDFFDVDSYSGEIDYANIPSYVSDTTGQTYELRDCLDFRPRVDDASTINSGGQDRSYDGTGASTVDVVKFNSNVRTDFEYYVPRIDKIFLDKEGNFLVSKGASALEPQFPKNLDNAMHLYTLSIPAYTLSTDSIAVEQIDNRRYTMRDIGKLEKRLENVEYYTQLSLLEAQAQNLQIQDADGFDRFKNGFIVDNFTGHNVGDVGNVDYKAAMDMSGGYLRPTFNEDAVKLIEADSDGSIVIDRDRVEANYQKTGDLITLPYTEATVVDQNFASKFINVNPFNVFTWVGTIDLSPATDEWKETERAPELLINRDGAFDTLARQLGNEGLNSFEIGTVWNEWQDFWTGNPRDVSSVVGPARRTHEQVAGRGRVLRANVVTTTEQRVSQTRTGIRQIAVPQVVRNSIGDRIINVAFVPFIRSRDITFTVTRMKPNTQVYAFFDNVDVTSYITPTGGSLGGDLITDANGAASGTFSIPDPKVDANPRWRTGQRVFRLTSSSTDDRVSDIATSAEADYVARGTLETVQNTVISTREIRVVRESANETRQITRTSTRTEDRQVGWWDPLAQTFLIDDVGGIFLTSIDLYFQSKDDTIPITVQLREVVNGYPSTTILPFSEVTLNPSSVNVSADATTATTFTFPSPVFIQENVEYCFVVLANSNNYNAWVSRMGEKVVGSDRLISAQPYAGVLFKSQNGSTWTAEQNEDMKFKLKRAEFSNVTGVVTLTNNDLPTRTLKNNPLRTTNGSDIIRVFHPNHGMHGTNNNVTIAGLTAATSYGGILGSSINGTYTSISNVTLDSYDITIADSSTATSSGDVGGSSVTATQNRLYDVLNLHIQTLTVPGTNITYTMHPTTGRSIHGTETEFVSTRNSNAISVIANDNIYFDVPQMIASSINATNEISDLTTGPKNKSLFVDCSLTTTNTKLSPVIDTGRLSAFTIQNRLNEPVAGNTPNFIDDTANTGTSSAAVYITKPVVLENVSTALDIRLTSNIRSTSSVEVYYRVTGGEEVRNISDLSWTPFNSDGSEDVTVVPAEDEVTFKEYKYSDSDIHDFTAFQIKIVMKGSNSAYPPIIRDMRGIALAV
jgi:hypothetical protein